MLKVSAYVRQDAYNLNTVISIQLQFTITYYITVQNVFWESHICKFLINQNKDYNLFKKQKAIYLN